MKPSLVSFPPLPDLMSRRKESIWVKEIGPSAFCNFLGVIDVTTFRSSGYMCVKGWKIDRFNPAKIPIITHEMDHEPEFLDLRGGPKTAGLSSPTSEKY